MVKLTLEEMGVEVRAPNPSIPLLLYPSRAILCETHLRPQEFYESPHFRGKVGFTLEEFMAWYPQSQGKSEFTYYSDWSGFNTPGEYFEPFFEGKFDPLSPKEDALISFLKTVPRPFYMIATFRNCGEAAAVVRHELGHSMWATNQEYRSEAETLVREFDLRDLFQHLKEKGYGEDVLLDEAHAQSIYHRQSAREFIPTDLSARMRSLFARFFPKDQLDVYLKNLPTGE